MKTTTSNMRALLHVGSPAFRWSRKETADWFDDTCSSSHPDTTDTDPSALLRPVAAALDCTSPSLATAAVACDYDWTMTEPSEADLYRP